MKKILFLLGTMALFASVNFTAQAETICTTDYTPVCGVDGQTYANQCEAGTTPIAYNGICEGAGFNADLRPLSLLIRWGYLDRNTTGTLTNMDGYVEMLGQGKIFPNRTILFENSDIVLSPVSPFTKLDWNSSIETDWDGVKVRLYPASIDQRIKIKLGDWTRTYSFQELRTLNSTVTIDSANHQGQIKSLGQVPFRSVLLYMAWGKLPQFMPVWSDTKKTWKGKITFTDGSGKLVRTFLFEANDTITPPPQAGCAIDVSGSGTTLSGCSTVNEINFSTITTNHYEGLLLKVGEDTEMLTVELNGAVHSYNMDELRELNVSEKLDNNGNGYVIRNVFLRPYDLLSGILDRRARLWEKLFGVEDRLAELKDLFQIDVSGVEGMLRLLKSYNLPKELYLNLETKVTAFKTLLSDSSLTKDRLTAALKDMTAFLQNLLAQAKLQKFNQNLIPFKDVDDQEWYHDYVNTMKRLRIINGYLDRNGQPLGIFVPGNNVSFGEILKIVLNATNQGEGSSLWDNTDVLQQETDDIGNHWAKQFLQIALYKNYRIVTDDNFALSLPATRGQVIGLILDALGMDSSGALTNCFKDMAPNYEYAKDVCQAKEMGLVSGNPDGTFQAERPVNRAEVAKIIAKVLELFGNE